VPPAPNTSPCPSCKTPSPQTASIKLLGLSFSAVPYAVHEADTSIIFVTALIPTPNVIP
jgi:hypothetical protein